MPILVKQPILRDRRYLDSAREAACIVCGRHDGTVVMAHIRWGFGAMGMKPPDNHAVPLCGGCHDQQHRIGERSFWMASTAIDSALLFNALLAMARERYREWKDG